MLAWYSLNAPTSDSNGQIPPATPAAQPHAAAPSVVLSTPPASSSPAAVSQVASAQGDTGADWTALYTSRDPYPAVIALREAKQKGTFGASLQFHMACMEATLVISRPTTAYSLDPTVPDVQVQARLQAKQEIEVRCSRWTGVDILALSQPLPGDAAGERYGRALNTIRGASAFDDSKRFRDALKEAADQGHLAEATSSVLSNVKTWRGESWKGRAREFDAARSIAEFLATSNSAAAGTDLRMLTACYRESSCQADKVSNSLSHFPAEQRPVIEALARDMAQTMRAGDVGPWLPVKTKGSTD